MRLSNTIAALATVGLLGLSCGKVQANGINDLKAALARLQGNTPVKAVLEVKSSTRRGEGKDADEREGQASIGVEAGPSGMQVLYSKDILTRMANEEIASGKDSKAKTPTLTALRDGNARELMPMLSAAGGLTRMLSKAVFKSEKASTYGGKPARLLSFELPLDVISEKDRKYVKKFDASFSIWIADDGTPLASQGIQNIAGSIFVVIRFTIKNEDSAVYAVVGDRLLTLRKEASNSASGAGEQGDSKTVKTLQVQS
jgi:hypothetical protein